MWGRVEQGIPDLTEQADLKGEGGEREGIGGWVGHALASLVCRTRPFRQ